MRRLPDGRVVHVQVVADGPHDHVAGVEPDAALHRQSVRPAHLLAVAAHGRLDGQGGVTGAHGVILMGYRGPKEGHNAIAHDLVHRALIAVHRGHQVLQDRVEDLPGFLGVTIGDQLQGALQVGKQHRDLLAFAFQVAARRQNLLGQVRWRVGEWLALLGAGGWYG